MASLGSCWLPDPAAVKTSGYKSLSRLLAGFTHGQNHALASSDENQQAHSGIAQQVQMILSLSLFQIERDQDAARKICGRKNITDLSGKPAIIEGNKVTLVFQTSDFNPESHRHAGFLASYKKAGPSSIPTDLHITDATIK